MATEYYHKKTLQTHILSFSLQKLGGSENPQQKFCLKLVYESVKALKNGILQKKSTRFVNVHSPNVKELNGCPK